MVSIMLNMQTLHESALSYAERSFPVFPIKPLQKRPATRNGFKDASMDVPRVNAWWERNAGYNIGLNCEPMLILDVDRKNGGDETFARMCSEIGASIFEGVPLVATPGGRHFWFRRPDPPISRHNGILPGIDLLGVGGYAIAPPSVRSDGSYRWAAEFEDDAEELRPGDLPEFPRVVYDYLIAVSATPEFVTPSKLVAVRSVAPAESGIIDDGWRNSRLASLAGTLVAGDYGEAVGTVLHAVNEKHCVPPLPVTEVDSIVKSASRNFRERYVEATFVKPWLRSDFGTTDARKQLHALRLLVLYAKWAKLDGSVDPPRDQLMELLGLSKREFYEARGLLEQCGTIVVHERGWKMSSVILLQWMPVALSPAA
jgi:hypothetical protein